MGNDIFLTIRESGCYERNTHTTLRWDITWFIRYSHQIKTQVIHIYLNSARIVGFRLVRKGHYALQFVRIENLLSIHIFIISDHGI